MAAKPIGRSVAATILAEWRTGEYSQQNIADRNKVSKGVVNKLCKGISQDTAIIVTAGIQYQQGLAVHDDRNVTAITDIVDRKVMRREILSEMAMQNATESMSAPCETQNDYRARGDTIQKAVDVVDPIKPAQTAIQINNTSNIPAGMAAIYAALHG